MSIQSTDSRQLRCGDAVYARRSGNKTFAWYVIVVPAEGVGTMPAAWARREGSNGQRYMLFAEVKHIDCGTRP